jgi:hypothetical protein
MEGGNFPEPVIIKTKNIPLKAVGQTSASAGAV